ncbi:MAG: anaerobic ribonucleoside-triphosphate reductase activating protein [Smithellaceae bacterium]|nr:anaerobic ribonucleoside-triphosphate reductase activating protein [Smithellaceae bacterium]
MRIGGLQKVSLIDYPEKICAIIFTQGCNFRCPYCHNPELVDPKRFGDCLPEREVLSFLKTRKGKLDAVTITGGEPTLQENLSSFIAALKDMDFAIKLDTNGSRPDVIRSLIERKMLDYIAMDIKGPLSKYERITKREIDNILIVESIASIKGSGVLHEFRTTAVKSLLRRKDFEEIVDLIGDSCYVLQPFVSGKTLMDGYSGEKSYSQAELDAIKIGLEGKSKFVTVRSS